MFGKEAVITTHRISKVFLFGRSLSLHCWANSWSGRLLLHWGSWSRNLFLTHQRVTPTDKGRPRSYMTPSWLILYGILIRLLYRSSRYTLHSSVFQSVVETLPHAAPLIFRLIIHNRVGVNTHFVSLILTTESSSSFWHFKRILLLCCLFLELNPTIWLIV